MVKRDLDLLITDAQENPCPEDAARIALLGVADLVEYTATTGNTTQVVALMSQLRAQAGPLAAAIVECTDGTVPKEGWEELPEGGGKKKKLS